MFLFGINLLVGSAMKGRTDVAVWDERSILIDTSIGLCSASSLMLISWRCLELLQFLQSLQFMHRYVISDPVISASLKRLWMFDGSDSIDTSGLTWYPILNVVYWLEQKPSSSDWLRKACWWILGEDHQLLIFRHSGLVNADSYIPSPEGNCWISLGW